MYMHFDSGGSGDPGSRGQAADEAEGFISIIRRQSVWWLCPYGWWQESDGSYVVFDRLYRPIFRVRASGGFEIVPSDEFIRYRSQRWLHNGFGPSPDHNTKRIVTDLIARYNLAPELRRRRDLLRRGRLPRCSIVKLASAGGRA